MRATIYTMCLCLFLFSCDKDDKEEFTPLTGQILLKKVYIENEPWYEYIYSKNNFIQEEKSKYHYTKYHYKGAQLVSADHYWDEGIWSSNSYILDATLNREEWVNPDNTKKYSTTIYEYADGKMTESSVLSRTAKYKYDNDNRVNQEVFYNENNKRTGYIDYLYDANGNLSKQSHYWVLETGESKLSNTKDYLYDDKNNPYKAFSSLISPGLYTNTNNIVKEIYTVYNMSNETVESKDVTDNIYEYNSSDYPIVKNGDITYEY